jgi:hypothetical protein
MQHVSTPHPSAPSSKTNSYQIIFLILIPCIIDYVEINQLNALNYMLLYFSFKMVAACFGITMPSSGSENVPF